MTSHPLVAAYLWEIRHTRSDDGRLIPLALATAGGSFEGAVGRQPDAPADSRSAETQEVQEQNRADAQFCHMVAELSFPVAQRLADLDAQDPFCRALGIASREDLLLCIAIVLFLKPQDAVLGKVSHTLSGTVQAKVEAARREILRTLRQLMYRHDHTKALALERTRGTVAMQSHYAREILLLTLGAIGNQPPAIADRREIQAIWDEQGAAWEQPSGPTIYRQLACAVILALKADLKWIAQKSQWIGWRQSARNQPVSAQTPDPDRKRDPSQLVEDVPLTNAVAEDVPLTEGDDDEPNRSEDTDGTDPPDAEDAEDEKRDEESEESRDEDRPERLPDRRDPHAPTRNDAQLERYAEVLLQVVEAFESASDAVKCGGNATPLCRYSRFRYAAQVRSFFSGTPYRAAHRDVLDNDLRPIFAADPEDRFGIVEAMKVYLTCPGGSRWSESDDRLRTAVIADVVAAFNGDLADQAQEEEQEARHPVIEGIVELAELARKNPLCHIPIEIDKEQLKADPGVVSVRHWLGVVTILDSRELSSGLRRFWPGGLMLLATLRPNLERLMDLDAARALQALVDAMHRQLGCVRPPLNTAEDRAQLPNALDTWRERKRPASGDLGPLWEQMRKLVNRLIGAIPAEPAAVPRVDEAMVRGFFKQLSSRNVDAETVGTWTRNNWEFLAYRIAFPKGQTVAPAYSEIYRIVADYTPLPANHRLQQFYRSLPERQPILDRLNDAIADYRTSANGAHRP